LRRDFGETQYRFTDEATSTFYDKKFSWIRSYNLVWNFTKSLRFNYTATNDGVIDEPEGRINDQVKRDSLWKNVLRFGRTKNYQHNIGLSYNLPFSKIPALDWITVKAQYNATYSWTAAALNLDSLGNTIQNSQKRQLTGDFQFTKLYNKSKFLKKINTPKRPNAKKPEKPKFPEKPVFPKPLSEIEDKEEREKEKEKRKAELKKWRGEMAKVRAKIEPSDGARAVLRPLMFLQRARLTYNEDFSTVLPGFMGMSRYLGQDVTFTQPGVDFIIGLQPDQSWLDRAAQRGMITDNIFLNGQVLQTHNTNYTAKEHLST
jgi:cell surface protein SprA